MDLQGNISHFSLFFFSDPGDKTKDDIVDDLE